MSYIYGWLLESLEDRFNQIMIDPKTKEIDVDDEKQKLKKCNLNPETKKEPTRKCNTSKNNNVRESKKCKKKKSEENHHMSEKKLGSSTRLDEKKVNNEICNFDKGRPSSKKKENMFIDELKKEDSKKNVQSLMKNESSQSSNKKEKLNVNSNPNKSSFLCARCGDIFTSESRLKSHRSIHNMEERMIERNKNIFRCLECKKNFDQSAKLLVHRHSHSQSCTFCNICHTRVEDLRDHRRDVHELNITFTA